MEEARAARSLPPPLLPRALGGTDGCCVRASSCACTYRDVAVDVAFPLVNICWLIRAECVCSDEQSKGDCGAVQFKALQLEVCADLLLLGA